MPDVLTTARKSTIEHIAGHQIIHTPPSAVSEKPVLWWQSAVEASGYSIPTGYLLHFALHPVTYCVCDSRARDSTRSRPATGFGGGCLRCMMLIFCISIQDTNLMHSFIRITNSVRQKAYFTHKALRFSVWCVKTPVLRTEYVPPPLSSSCGSVVIIYYCP